MGTVIAINASVHLRCYTGLKLMDQERFTYLFNKQLHSEATEPELNELAALLNNDAYNKLAEQLLDQYWALTSTEEMDPEISAKILKYIFTSHARTDNRRRAVLLKIGIAAAAAIAIIGTFSLLHFMTPVSTPMKTAKVIIEKTNKHHGKTSYHTKNAHRKVNLPDGSTVILNDHSTLTFNSDFNHKNRQVQLIGEGYFDIKHHHNKPFIVTTGHIRTTVLGTAFNISAYRNQKVEITVTRGKVSVLSGSNVVGILTPNRSILLPPVAGNPVISNVVAKQSIQWQEHDIYFDDVSFEEATTILSRKFNVPISIVNEQARKCRFTATFLQGESLDEILKIICSFNNAQFEKGVSGIIIKGPGC